MPVEFHSDEQAAAYGRFAGAPSWAERFFFRQLVDRRRVSTTGLGSHFSWATVRFLGTFLECHQGFPQRQLVAVTGPNNRNH